MERPTGAEDLSVELARIESLLNEIGLAGMVRKWVTETLGEKYSFVKSQNGMNDQVFQICLNDVPVCSVAFMGSGGGVRMAVSYGDIEIRDQFGKNEQVKILEKIRDKIKRSAQAS